MEPARQPAPSPQPREGPGVALRGLTITAGGLRILEGADADFLPGEMTLIAGPSGAGKTILLKVLAGLLGRGTRGIALEGSVKIGGEEILSRRSGRGPSRAGIVFQSFALFDELSAEENILFGHDHRRRDRGAPRPRGDRRAIPRRLLAELGIPAGVRVSVLSGGQKQRLAIARALAFDPDLIAYDEPTSGLDPETAARVAELIHDTGRSHGKTTVIVTHDLARFEKFADRIYRIEGRRLVLIAAGANGSPGPRPETGGGPPEAREPPELARRIGRAFGGLLGFALGFLEATGRSLEALGKTALSVPPVWRSPRWGLRYLRHYLRLVASPSALVYFGAAGALAGFVSTYFTFKFLPFRAYTEPLLTEELLHALGFALYRVIVPVLITVLIAARCGAAAASDIGTRRYTQGIEALESMGARPSRYLLTNLLYAFALGAPLLVGLAFTAAWISSFLVFSYGYPQYDPLFWDNHFHRGLRTPEGSLYIGTWWLLGKVLLSGLGVGTIAYHRGMGPKLSAVEVSTGITSTIIWSTIWVLLVHFAFAFLEF